MTKVNLRSINKELIPHQSLIERFPFPFKGNSYRYSNNAAPLQSGNLLDITPEYFEEIELKRHLLETAKERTYQSFPHSIEAQWEILEMIMHEMVSVHPNYFSLSKNENSWTFRNHLLGEEQSFTFGDVSTLPYEPLDFIGRHVQEDLVYLGQRDGDLYLDAGQLAFPANWSLAFDLGMEFLAIHSPVPKAFTGSGLAEKVRGFILRMEAGKPWTRFNWTITVELILDTAPETFDEWGPKKEKVTAENAGQLVYLRVEDQRLFRLPRSNGILFGIHTHFISLEELCETHQWMNQFYNVLTDLPDDLAEYKGFISFKDRIIKYLEKKIVNSSLI
jgi:dimethylamine monooxygenase subunit A